MLIQESTDVERGKSLYRSNRITQRLQSLRQDGASQGRKFGMATTSQDALLDESIPSPKVKGH